MKKQIISALIFFTALIAAAGPAAAVDFPGRQQAKYQNLKTIDIEELHRDFLDHKAVVIDVRSRLEFDTIHIRNARYLSLSDNNFADKLKNIAADSQGKKIAFY